MKNLYVVFCFLFITALADARAQIDYGFAGSFNISKLDGDFRNSSETYPVLNFGGGIGVILVYHIIPNLGIQVEPMFMERGGQNGGSGDDWNKIQLTYLDVPIFLRYQYKIPYFMIGYSKSYLVTAHLLHGRDARNGIEDLINDGDSGINLGVGFNIKAGNSSKFMLEINYFRGFSNIKELNDYVGEDLIQQGVTAKVGVLFELNFSSENKN